MPMCRVPRFERGETIERARRRAVDRKVEEVRDEVATVRDDLALAKVDIAVERVAREAEDGAVGKA